ncbi:hypothetical protein CASFOL_026013 [Castilleja foliolosa]|uniref:Transmembrane protein n=1 Tax=Castilleja foliolosa TaxID=1961234 RepID=A0ABD3CTZ4_9LAMI
MANINSFLVTILIASFILYFTPVTSISDYKFLSPGRKINSAPPIIGADSKRSVSSPPPPADPPGGGQRQGPPKGIATPPKHI